jgi:uncharacterized protein
VSAESPPPCLTRHGTQWWLAVSVVPNAKRSSADGLHDGALRVRLAAPPVDGKANEALVAWVAEALGLPRRAVSLVRGQAARRKWLALDGPLPEIEAAVTRLVTTSATRV